MPVNQAAGPAALLLLTVTLMFVLYMSGVLIIILALQKQPMWLVNEVLDIGGWDVMKRTTTISRMSKWPDNEDNTVMFNSSPNSLLL